MIREASEKRDKAYSRLFELHGLRHDGTTQHEIDLLLAVNEYVSVYGVVPEELFSCQFINGLMRKIRDNQTPATGTAVGWFPDRELMREWS